MARKKQPIIELTLPASWDDITLETYEKVQEAYQNIEDESEYYKLIAVLAEKTNDEIKQLPMDVISNIMRYLSFLNDKPEVGEDSNQIEINGEIYNINTEEQLKFGEYTDFEDTRKNSPFNYHVMLAILCRKEGEVYNDDFIANKVEERANMFAQQPITKILPLINFFLHCPNYLGSIIQSYSKHLEAVTSQLLQSTKHTLKDGGGKGLSSYLLMKKLKKLEKSFKSIQQQS